MPDENNAESSTAEEIDAASDAALAERDFTRYTEIENARESGKPIPEVPAPSKETSAKTPAPEPGTAPVIQEPKKQKSGEDRKVELAAEIKEMLRQRADLRAELERKTEPGEKKAEPPPAPVKAATEAAKAAAGTAPKKPSLADFKTFAEYDAANDAYIGDLVAFKAGEVILTREAERATAEQSKAFVARWEAQKAAAAEEHADLAEIAFSKETPITPVMDEFIRDSDNGVRILYALGENGSAEGKRIAGLTRFAAVRALVGIEQGLSPAKKETAPPVRKHTAAPPPATNLGGRDTEPSDPVDAALRSGDVAGYIAKANARDRKAAQ